MKQKDRLETGISTLRREAAKFRNMNSTKLNEKADS